MKTNKKFQPAKRKGYGQRQMNVYYLSVVTWNFAHGILWSEQKFSDEEISAVNEHLIRYFREANHRKKAFISFCERIILTRNYLASKGTDLPAPAVWLDPDYYQGFPETKGWYEAIEATRCNASGHLKHYTVMANHYYLYAMKPSKSIVKQCREKLLGMNAKCLLELFYNAIAHLNLKR